MEADGGADARRAWAVGGVARVWGWEQARRVAKGERGKASPGVGGRVK